MQYFVDILNFLQAIAWPVVAIFIFRYLSHPLRSLMVSINQAVHDRGLKFQSPTGVGVEIPGPQEEMANIQELISQAKPEKYLTTNDLETLQESIEHTPHSSEEVLEMHEASLVNEVHRAINKLIKESKNNTSEKDLLIGLLCDSYITLYFERSIKVIQKYSLTLLLKKAINVIPNPLPISEAKTIWNNNKHLTSTETFEKWIEILKKAKFIKVEEKNIILTDIGKDFARYAMNRGYM